MKSCSPVLGFSRVCAAITLCLAILLSCSDYECTCPEDTGCLVPEDATVVDSMAAFYEAQDADCYADVLHESFRFVFTPAAAESLGLPPEAPWWEKEADLASTVNMFADASVTSISLSLEKVIDWYAYEDDLTGLAGWSARFDLGIDITVEAEGEEPFIFIVRGTWLDVMVVPGEEGEPWSILWIAELEKSLGTAGDGAAGLATEHSTWGMIKAMYAY